ncbi:unnamed protein product, partial [Iphiclides podalirius]
MAISDYFNGWWSICVYLMWMVAGGRKPLKAAAMPCNVLTIPLGQPVSRRQTFDSRASVVSEVFFGKSNLRTLDRRRNRKFQEPIEASKSIIGQLRIVSSVDGAVSSGRWESLRALGHEIIIGTCRLQA